MWGAPSRTGENRISTPHDLHLCSSSTTQTLRPASGFRVPRTAATKSSSEKNPTLPSPLPKFRCEGFPVKATCAGLYAASSERKMATHNMIVGPSERDKAQRDSKCKRRETGTRGLSPSETDSYVAPEKGIPLSVALKSCAWL